MALCQGKKWRNLMTEQKSKLIYAQLKNGNTYESSAYFVYYEDEEGAEISP